MQEVVVRGPRMSERIFGSTPIFITGALEMLVLLYFLLAVGDLFLQKLIKVLPLLQDKKKAVTIFRETESSISTYLVTVALVNAGLGLVVALVMRLVGMPNPLLWGALAAVAEFVPYLGATTMLGILSLAGLATFPQLGHAFLVPGSYLAVNLIQANFVTPTVLGRRLTFNPVAILIGARVLVVALGSGRRLHRRTVAGHVQDLLRPYRVAGVDRGISRRMTE